jgi:hypothetical protein
VLEQAPSPGKPRPPGDPVRHRRGEDERKAAGGERSATWEPGHGEVVHGSGEQLTRLVHVIAEEEDLGELQPGLGVVVVRQVGSQQSFRGWHVTPVKRRPRCR